MNNAIRPNTLGTDPTFATRPARNGWVWPFSLGLLGSLPILVFPGRSDILIVGGAILAVGTALAILVAASRIRLDRGVLCVRHYALRSRCIRLMGLRSVTAHRGRFSETPTLELVAADGARLRVRLGSWRREDEFLAGIADAAARSGATVEGEAVAILRDLPAAGAWARRNAGRPTTAVGRWLARLPQPFRAITQIGLVLLAIVLINVGFDLAARLSENVLFPRQIDPAWAQRFHVPGIEGDTWVGNLVASSGDRMVLATREDVNGFWGTLRVRGSVDGGATWSEATAVSGEVDAARHTLVAAQDGSLIAAWAQRGPAPSTQRLVTRRSLDGGVSWAAPIVVATPGAGLVGLPVLVATDAARIVAYTDGVTGQIWAQRLTNEGASDGEPVELGVSSRQLYSDAEFADGYLAMTSVGARIVLSYVEHNDRLKLMISDDAGHSWRSSEIDQLVYGGHPRLASDGATILLAVADPNTASRSVHRPFIRIWRSPDGGATWERIPSVSDVADVGPLDVAWSGGQWRLIYAACPGALNCATPPRIWYATSADGREWSGASIVSPAGNVAPVGVVAHDTGVSAVWARKLAVHDWRFHVARRQDR